MDEDVISGGTRQFPSFSPFYFFDHPFRFLSLFTIYFSLASSLTRLKFQFFFEHAVTVTVTLKRIYLQNFDPQTFEYCFGERERVYICAT